MRFLCAKYARNAFAARTLLWELTAVGGKGAGRERGIPVLFSPLRALGISTSSSSSSQHSLLCTATIKLFCFVINVASNHSILTHSFPTLNIRHLATARASDSSYICLTMLRVINFRMYVCMYVCMYFQKNA